MASEHIGAGPPVAELLDTWGLDRPRVVAHDYGGAELALPVTVIWGAADTWSPVDRATRRDSLIPGTRTEIIPGVSHLIQYDAPALAVRRSL